MKRTRKIFALASLLLVVGWQRGTAADEVRWKFGVGDQYKVKISQKSNLNSKVNRTRVDVELELNCEMDWKVLSIAENGNATIEQAFTRMQVKVVKTAKPTIVYDTDQESPAEKNAKHFKEVYDKLVGIRFKVEMTDRGQIQKVEPDQKDKETLRKIPESMEARRLFEKRGLEEIYNSGGFVLPADSVEKGFQWPVRKEQKLTFGKANFETLFTYLGTGESDALARFRMEATARLADQPQNPAEKPMQLRKQEQTGEIQFDTRNGFLRSIVVNQEMETEKPYREMLIETVSSLEYRVTIEKSK